MSSVPRDIAIVGAGTAGAASAHFLARAGHRVTLFERVADPMPIGAGLLLQPSGLAVLAQLGLLGAALNRGARIDRLYGQNQNGRVVMDMSYRDWQRADAHGLGIHRGALFDLLQQGLAAAGVTLRYGVEITVQKSVADKTELFDAAGVAHGAFDLVVIADGMRSALREGTGIPVSVKPYAWGALWAICEDTGDSVATLSQRYRAATEMLGLLPTGSVMPGGKQLLSIFWSLPVADFPAWRKAGLSAWKKTVLALAPEYAPIIAQIHIAEQVRFADYADVTMPQWHTDRAVVIGDAAHATSPQLGQGTNLALVDAWALSRVLAASNNIAEAVTAYSDARRNHLAYYQRASHWLTPFFQSYLGSAPAVRDALMGYTRHVPYLRRQFAATVAGTKSGLFSSAISLP